MIQDVERSIIITTFVSSHLKFQLLCQHFLILHQIYSCPSMMLSVYTIEKSFMNY